MAKPLYQPALKLHGDHAAGEPASTRETQLMRILCFLLPLWLFAWAGARAAPVPETIYINGKVWTVDAQQPEAQAFAVHKGRFIAVGTNERVQKLAGKHTRVVDLGQRRVLPGFIDGHQSNQL